MRVALPALLTVVLTAVVPPAAQAAPPSCPATVDESAFATTADLHRMNATIAGFGLRITGSPEHKAMVNWLERQVHGLKTTSQKFEIQRWQPLTHSLETSAFLTAGLDRIKIAGAIPYSRPALVQTGKLTYLPATEPITRDNAQGKIVIRDFPPVDRGYTAESLLDQDLTAAGIAQAAGLIIAFDLPREQVRGYYDPHTGTHYRVPGVFVGGDEARELKQRVGQRASISVLAYTEKSTTRSLIATLPGQSEERIVFDTNTDGNTWVQDNGNAALIALARYFAKLPLACRPRTIQFVFATGHLNRPTEGTEFLARQLDADYDKGTVAFAFAVEHLGTREFVAVPTEKGRELRPTGLSEFAAWFAGSPKLAAAATTALANRGVDRTIVLPGIDPPNPARVPPQCSFGGLGTHLHSHLVPATAMISGPWSLWAPSFGEDAIDFTRMHAQTLAAGDAVLALATTSRAEIAGPYLAYRQARAAGAAGCPHDLPPVQAPGGH